MMDHTRSGPAGSRPQSAARRDNSERRWAAIARPTTRRQKQSTTTAWGLGAAVPAGTSMVRDAGDFVAISELTSALLVYGCVLAQTSDLIGV